ncbi:MAG: BamA/TamA family outer membrane protein [Bacteroidota bacterium]
MKYTGIIALFALLSLAGRLPAQSNMLGGENIIQQKDFAWKSVGTEHFDVHFYTRDPVTATIAARYAEEAMWEVCRALDFKNRSKYSLYIFLSPNDYIQSNLYPQRQTKEGGRTNLYANAGAVVFPGDHKELYGRIKSEVARMVIHDYYYGGAITASIPYNLLLFLPRWYAEGLPAFLGEGWTFDDELWITSLENADMLEYALEGDEYVNRVARKSIWYFIASTYGTEKLSEIFYMTRLTRSVEDGLVHVLGITLKTLTERWREFILQRISENGTFRDKLRDQADPLRLKTKERMLGFRLNPVAPVAAVYLERNGKQRVALYDLNTQELRETPIEGGFPTEQLTPFAPEMPMVWSPDGKAFITTIYRAGTEQFAYYNVGSGEVQYINFQPRLERIFQMDWSHDGRQIVASGLRTGSIDLFRFTPGSNGFVPLTEDAFDNLNPIWSQDDARIYYASTRPNDSIKDTDVPHDIFRSHYDIWELTLEDGSVRRVTNTPIADEFPVHAESSFEIQLLSNETGISNLYKRNVFVGDSVVQSNISQGIHTVNFSDSLVVFSVPELGRMTMFNADREEFLKESVVLKSMLRLQTDKRFDMARRSKALQARLDSLKREMEKFPEKFAENKPGKNPKDTSKTQKDNGVKYYVFDEEDKPRTVRRRPSTRRRAKARRNKKPAKPDFSGVKVSSPGASKTRWAADQVSTRFGFDPVFKLNVSLEARLKTLKGDKMLAFGFRPYWNRRSSDTWVQYTNLKGRVDWFAAFERNTRFLNQDEFTTRYGATRLRGGAVYPLSRFLSVGAEAHAVHLSRRNMLLLIPKDIDGEDVAVGARLNLTYDNTKRNLQYVRSGTWASVNISNSYSIGAGTYNFTTAQFDYRKYLPLGKSVLVGRLLGGWSSGANEQQFFMGGTDDWLFSRFQNPSDFPIEGALPAFNYMQYVTPFHGFRFNARNGTKYVGANAELRIPLTRMFKSSLNTNPLYNLEFIPFFDIGTTWTEGNPLSQKNPIDTETIDSYPLTITVQTLKSPFIMGFGAGARIMLFGYWTRFDLGWGVDDFTVLTPRLHLSLGKNF